MNRGFHLRGCMAALMLICLIACACAVLGSCTTEEKTIIEPQIDRSLDPALTPQIVSTYPPANSTGPFTIYTPPFYYCGFECNPCDCNRPAHFSIRFNKVMLVSSLGPPTVRCEGFDVPVRAELVNPGGGMLTYAQYQLVSNVVNGGEAVYAIGKSYRVTIDTSAKDVYGTNLPAAYSFSFVPEPNFRVLRTEPSAGDTIQSAAGLRIQFNSMIDSTILPSVSIDPPVDGKFQIYGTDLYFYPVKGFTGGVRYTFKAVAGARDSRGHTLPHLFELPFESVGFNFLGCNVADSGMISALNGQVYLTFSTPVDPLSARENITMVPAGEDPIIPDGSRIYLSGNFTDFLPGIRYQVTIQPGLVSVAGETLRTQNTWDFFTPAFNVVSMTPKSKSAPRDSRLFVHCNGDVDTSTVRSAFSISPTVAGHILIQGRHTDMFTFVPDSIYLPSTPYVVTIAKTLKSVAGYPLRTFRTFKFTTVQ